MTCVPDKGVGGLAACLGSVSGTDSMALPPMGQPLQRERRLLATMPR